MVLDSKIGGRTSNLAHESEHVLMLAYAEACVYSDALPSVVSDQDREIIAISIHRSSRLAQHPPAKLTEHEVGPRLR